MRDSLVFGCCEEEGEEKRREAEKLGLGFFLFVGFFVVFSVFFVVAAFCLSCVYRLVLVLFAGETPPPRPASGPHQAKVSVGRKSTRA
jgi:hypothetical protein